MNNNNKRPNLSVVEASTLSLSPDSQQEPLRNAQRHSQSGDAQDAGTSSHLTNSEHNDGESARKRVQISRAGEAADTHENTNISTRAREAVAFLRTHNVGAQPAAASAVAATSSFPWDTVPQYDIRHPVRSALMRSRMFRPKRSIFAAAQVFGEDVKVMRDYEMSFWRSGRPRDTCRTLQEILNSYPENVVVSDIPTYLYEHPSLYTHTNGTVMLRQIMYEQTPCIAGTVTVTAAIEPAISNIVQVFLSDILSGLSDITERLLRAAQWGAWGARYRKQPLSELQLIQAYQAMMQNLRDRFAMVEVSYAEDAPRFMQTSSIIVTIPVGTVSIPVRQLVSARTHETLTHLHRVFWSICHTIETSTRNLFSGMHTQPYHSQRDLGAQYETILTRVIDMKTHIDAALSLLIDSATLKRMLAAIVDYMPDTEQCVAIEVMENLVQQVYIPIMRNVSQKLDTVTVLFNEIVRSSTYQSRDDENIMNVYMLSAMEEVKNYHNNAFTMYPQASTPFFFEREGGVYENSSFFRSPCNIGVTEQVQMRYIVLMFPMLGMISSACDVTIRRMEAIQSMSSVKRNDFSRALETAILSCRINGSKRLYEYFDIDGELLPLFTCPTPSPVITERPKPRRRDDDNKPPRGKASATYNPT